MSEQIIHTFSVDTEKLKKERKIRGLAAPYGVLPRDGRKTAFAPGAFKDLIDEFDEDVKLYFNHDYEMPIGSVTAFTDTEAGLEVEARVDETPRANEVFALLESGTLNKFSVGIVGREFHEEDDAQVWTKADLHEVSVVPRPAFKTAAIAAVYSAEADSTKEKEIDEFTMNPDITNEVVELKEQFSDLERKVSVLGREEAKPAVTKFASAGAALKGLLTGDQAAKQTFAFTGATTADADATRPAFVGGLLRTVEENRDIFNLFNKRPHPMTMSVEYAQLGAATGTVGIQSAEGADLPYMEVAITSATAPTVTYGGYSALSRQAIELSDVSYLDTVLDFQAQQYAKATNGAVRAAVANAAGTSAVAALEADTGAAWVRLAGRARRAVKAANSQAGVAVVSYDVYERLISLVDGNGRPLFDLNGDGSNTIGTAGLVNADGRFAGLGVVIDDAAPEGTLWVAGSDAVTVFEQPGAPIRLQDENIINLTREFSLYGYVAVAVTNPKAIVRADVTL